jgi:NADH:ubiquinone reductase (H+-translocating)
MPEMSAPVPTLRKKSKRATKQLARRLPAIATANGRNAINAASNFGGGQDITSGVVVLVPLALAVTTMSERRKVVIVGGGFGGLSAAQRLHSNLVEVTVIDRRNYHLFQPLLYQVATGSLSPGEIAYPLRGVLSRQKNTRVWLGTVVDVDPDSKQVFLADGANVPYDSLIIAAGSQTSYFGNNEWQEWAPGLKSIEEATTIRHKILYAFEVAERISDPKQRAAWLTFVIVGAGATGVELSGAIAEIARQTLKNDFRSINPEEAQIILLDGGSRVLTPFPEDLSQKAHRSLAKLGVQVRCGAMVKGLNEEGVRIESSQGTEFIAAKTVVWGGGITASPLGKILADRTNAEIDRGGRVKVNPDLTIPNYPDIYVIGDLASAMDKKGKPLPGLAQVAMQGGSYAAAAILRNAKGQPKLPPFHYFDKGSLAVIGRAAAVADVFGAQISGFSAWMVWAFIHLLYLVTFQSRILVLVQWAIQDVTFSRGARLITGAARTDFNFTEEMSKMRTGREIKPEPVNVPH